MAIPGSVDRFDQGADFDTTVVFHAQRVSGECNLDSPNAIDPAQRLDQYICGELARHFWHIELLDSH